MPRYEMLCTLDGAEPPVARRLSVHSSTTLDALHLLLQAAFGWENQHLYGFAKGAGYWQTPLRFSDSGGDEPIAGKVVSDLLRKKGDVATYLYDYGDNWEVALTVEHTRRQEDPTPLLLSSAGPYALEDCGGVPGFNELTEIAQAIVDDRVSANADPELLERVRHYLGDDSPRTAKHFLGGPMQDAVQAEFNDVDIYYANDNEHHPMLATEDVFARLHRTIAEGGIDPDKLASGEMSLDELNEMLGLGTGMAPPQDVTPSAGGFDGPGAEQTVDMLITDLVAFTRSLQSPALDELIDAALLVRDEFDLSTDTTDVGPVLAVLRHVSSSAIRTAPLPKVKNRDAAAIAGLLGTELSNHEVGVLLGGLAEGGLLDVDGSTVEIDPQFEEIRDDPELVSFVILNAVPILRDVPFDPLFIDFLELITGRSDLAARAREELPGEMIPLGQAYGASRTDVEKLTYVLLESCGVVRRTPHGREATAFGKEILLTALLSNTLIAERYLEDFAEIFGIDDAPDPGMSSS